MHVPKPQLSTIQEACPFVELRESLTYEILSDDCCETSFEVWNLSDSPTLSHVCDEDKPECDRITHLERQKHSEEGISNSLLFSCFCFEHS